MVTDDSRIGECDECHACFKVPASFRADRARCRVCGGVVIFGRTHPVPRPPLEKSRKAKSVQRPSSSDERTTQGRPGPSSSSDDSHRAGEHASSHGTAVAPSAAPRPVAVKASVDKPSGEKPAPEKRAEGSKGPKKSGGVLGSIVAAAKAAMWRKKRDDAGSKD